MTDMKNNTISATFNESSVNSIKNYLESFIGDSLLDYYATLALSKEWLMDFIVNSNENIWIDLGISDEIEAIEHFKRGAEHILSETKSYIDEINQINSMSISFLSSMYLDVKSNKPVIDGESVYIKNKSDAWDGEVFLSINGCPKVLINTETSQFAVNSGTESNILFFDVLDCSNINALKSDINDLLSLDNDGYNDAEMLSLFKSKLLNIINKNKDKTEENKYIPSSPNSSLFSAHQIVK